MHPPTRELYFFLIDEENEYNNVLITPVISNAFVEINNVFDCFVRATDILSEPRWTLMFEANIDREHTRRGLLHLDAIDRLRLLSVLDAENDLVDVDDIVQTFEATHPDRIAADPEVWSVDVTRAAFLSLFGNGEAYTEALLRDPKGALVEFEVDQDFVDVVKALGRPVTVAATGKTTVVTHVLDEDALSLIMLAIPVEARRV